jgi:hypothetical protein
MLAKVWGEGDEREKPYTRGRECKLVQPLWKSERRFIKNLKTDLPYGPALPLLAIYTKEHKSTYKKHTCSPIFITALFTIVKLWNQPRFPTTGEWIKKTWYISTMENYSAIKMNGVMSFAGK